LRFDHRQKRWLIWREHWWAEDAEHKVTGLAKQAARHRYRLARHAGNEDERKREAKWALDSESRYRLDAALTLAQAEPALADIEQWDSDPWLVGVANGVLDLRTCKLRAGRQSDRITIHTNMPFDASAGCPLWEHTLGEIFEGSAEVIGFVHRAVGYSLTGDTSGQCIFLCYGEGSNGKSTFLETLRRVFGDYARNLPFSAFELKARSNIPNDVATLPGRRYVTAIETSDSIRLNEARLKALTGCDTITARQLYKEHFEFRPVAKFWLAFNHKPRVSDDSHGLWRRVRLIPFLRQFEKDRDEHLLEKLNAEGPGILAWAVRGCLAWQAEGLGMPPAVRAATEAYRKESDRLSEFLDDQCIIHPQARVPVGNLWATYEYWARQNGDRWPLDRRALTERMQKRFEKKRQGHSRDWHWLGVCREIDAQALGIPLDADMRADADVDSNISPTTRPI
jgi:putative DNA primase/helicase